MARVVILGSASAVPDIRHENTHILVQHTSRTILVDCPGSPLVRLLKAGIDHARLTDIILTHFHPDHVSGFAQLLMSLWLLGRKDPLRVYGLEETIERARRLMELHSWENWPNFYPVSFIPVAPEERAPVLEDMGIRVFASPVKHLIPTIGLRFEFGAPGPVVTYSCDTEPSPIVERLAEGADILIHEATGSSVGHTSPEKAGEIADRAGVKTLYLIHYPPQLIQPEALRKRARTTFQGPIYVAEDLMQIEVDSKK